MQLLETVCAMEVVLQASTSDMQCMHNAPTNTWWVQWTSHCNEQHLHPCHCKMCKHHCLSAINVNPDLWLQSPALKWQWLQGDQEHTLSKCKWPNLSSDDAHICKLRHMCGCCQINLNMWLAMYACIQFPRKKHNLHDELLKHQTMLACTPTILVLARLAESCQVLRELSSSWVIAMSSKCVPRSISTQYSVDTKWLSRQFLVGQWWGWMWSKSLQCPSTTYTHPFSWPLWDPTSGGTKVSIAI